MTRTLALRRPIALVALVMLLSTAGCGFLFGNSGSSGGSAIIHIVNGSNEPVHHVYVSASDRSSWGSDQLEDRVLPVGGTFHLAGVSAGTWDIRVVDRSGNHKTFFRQTVSAGNEYRLEVGSTGWTRGR